MFYVRKSEERGFANHGWLKSHHTFSFANYFDPQHMGFSVLRVINEDFIAGGGGFGTHPHRDMEIITYVTEGNLEHKDSMGNAEVIRVGEVQRMSAGTGVRHSEYNHSSSERVHLFQIWILPEKEGIEPSYDQKDFSAAIASGKLVLTASKHGGNGSVTLNQDINLYVAKPVGKSQIQLPLEVGRKGWLQVVDGNITIGSVELKKGDAVAFEGEQNPTLNCQTDSHFLFFDLPV